MAVSLVGQAQPPRSFLRIAWREGPEYPLGIQDSVLGIVHGQLVSAGGFSRHPKDVVNRFPDAFGGEKSGFTKIAFRLDAAHEASGWGRIPDMPGPARQGAAMVVVDGTLYAFGGFNYDAPHTYRNSCRLRWRNGVWFWETLSIELPVPMCEANALAFGTQIYLVGGTDFFTAAEAKVEGLGGKDADFYSDMGRDGRPIGRSLWSLDTTDPAAGWRRLPDRPGTGHALSACAVASGKIYVLGGFFSPARAAKPAYYNAIDSWAFDIASGTWSPLPDMPHGANRRAISYRDRYIILIGGYKYGQTRCIDGSLIDAYAPAEKGHDWKTAFEKTVLVYDAKTGRLEITDLLLDQTSWPMVTIHDDTIYCLGGEGGARLWHPATLQIGKITLP
jgi:hypothetical protein